MLILSALLSAIWMLFGFNLIDITMAIIITISMLVGGCAGYFVLTTNQQSQRDK